MTERNGTILLVEDEENLGTTLSEYLTSIGFVCHLAIDGASARELFKKTHPNIILMDIGLPDTSGLELAKDFRNERQDFVLLFLSALNDPDTKVEGLEIGAEDYITKPFALKELILRLDRILSIQTKATTPNSDEITIGDLKIWFKRFEVQKGDGSLQTLSQKECHILRLLYEKENEAVTREEIIENFWGNMKFPTNRTVDNYIVTLRKWCETSKTKNLEIQSIRGIGYKLVIK